MGCSVQEFLADLDRYSGCVPLDYLTSRLKDLQIRLDDVADCVQFGTSTYRRNLLHAGPAYQALILCWRSGQRSPIHDHRGSSCGVRVLRGAATETFFERNGHGMIYATASRELGEGQICGSYDADIHQMSNLQPPGQDLITLHVYSPPLLVMGTYSLTDASVGVFRDPIFEFCHGAGI